MRDPLVDQVLVLTTSQQHEEGIRAAITAGKDVYCEWPLTPTAAKSAELATLADAAGVKTQIGLQRQFAPAFRYAHDLIAQGYVGKVRSARMHVSVNMFGEIRANAVRWSLPIENFMSVIAIFGGHFFPVLFSVVGKPSSFSALTANQFPEVTIKETGEKIQTTSPDELLMHGTLADGGLFSIHIEGGKLSGSGCRSISLAMQVISRSPTPQHLVVSMKTSLSLGHTGIASLWSISRSLRSTSGSHGPAYRQA